MKSKTKMELKATSTFKKKDKLVKKIKAKFVRVQMRKRKKIKRMKRMSKRKLKDLFH